MAIFSKGLFILLINIGISNASSISAQLFDRDVSSFCVREKCTFVFPNGTSTSLPLTEFYHFMAKYVGHKGNADNKNDLELDSNLDKQNNSKSSTEKGENEYDQTIRTSFAPANQTNATEMTAGDVKEAESASVEDDRDSSFQNKYEGFSGSVSDSSCYCRVRQEDGTIQLKLTSNPSECVWIDDKDEKYETRSIPDGCKWPDPEHITDAYGTTIFTDKYGDPVTDKNHRAAYTDKYGNPITDSSGNALKTDSHGRAVPADGTSHTIRTTDEIDYDYESKEEKFQEEEYNSQVTEEEIEKAKKMTECASKQTENGITCVCNATYCDKFIPPERTPEWTYTWYMSSKEGHRFRKLRNNLMRYEDDEEGAFYVNTSQKYQEIIGFGGAFTDTSCILIKELSKATRRNLLEYWSYFGPLGINYSLGRVPIGGTDYSPKFYTYMDFEDNSTSNFMLTEQDFKYKIPIILQAMNLARGQMKLIGCAWSAPMWMKTERTIFSGSLKREYWPLWAEYHIKFLDQYETSGIKFWAISAGNEPMNYYYITQDPFINAMEWSPYEHSQWVGYHLNPTLKNSSHKDVLILALDENREFIHFYMKYFYEDYQLKYFDDPTYVQTNLVVDSVDGIALHGYMDYESNVPYLEKTNEMYPDEFLIYTEFSCIGAPQLGGWTCAESHATQIITALNNLVIGWIDWNIALDSNGGPLYLDLALHSPIIVDVKRDEFQKEPIYYIMGHFSIFLLPGSYRIEIEVPKGLENIYAVAVHRPDDGKVIVIYNKYESDKQVTFLIDKKYKLSLEVPAKSINSVLFW